MMLSIELHLDIWCLFSFADIIADMREASLLDADTDGIEIGGRYVLGSRAIVPCPYIALESLLERTGMLFNHSTSIWERVQAE